MKPKETIPKLKIPSSMKDIPVGDLEELLDDDLLRVPRSGKRQLMPIDRLR